jgi:tetratricopeptide (TPR) repeat protein
LLAGGLVGLSAAGQPPTATPTTGQDAPKPPAPTPLPEKAIELFNKKDVPGCYEELLKAARTNPMAPHPRVQLALLFFEARDGKSARAMLELAAREDPKHPDVYLTNASFAYGEGRVTDAILNLTVALKEADTARWNAVQRDRFTRNARDGLIACFETRARMSAEPKEHTSANWMLAKEQVLALIEADKKNAVFRQKLGFIEFQLDNPDAAVAAYTQAFKDDPTVDPPELQMALRYLERNNPEKTEEWLKKAASAHPKEAKVHRWYAEFLLNEGRLGEVEKHVKLAEEIAPTARDTLFIRGLYNRYKKNFGEAEKVFDDLSRKYPADIMVAANLALSLAESTDKVKQQRGVDLAETVVRQSPQNADGYAVLGWCLFKIGRLDDAEKALATAAQRMGFDSVYYFARLLTARGKEEDAYKMLKAVVELKGPFVYRDEAKKLFDELDKKLPKEKKEGKKDEKSGEKK